MNWNLLYQLWCHATFAKLKILSWSLKYALLRYETGVWHFWLEAIMSNASQLCTHTSWWWSSHLLHFKKFHDFEIFWDLCCYMSLSLLTFHIFLSSSQCHILHWTTIVNGCHWITNVWLFMYQDRTWFSFTFSIFSFPVMFIYFRWNQ